ncbi:Nif3-like dinuclear metal center hexameric protein [Flagellimonas sp. DF-77]|uniref:Nif3-like dinuclear metal center hexameric protein n=1 Tax=Flagellimonas algarum TaxID=3230298 RepID=UPI0033944E78
MTIKNIAVILEELAPLHYAEDFDNVGLLVGQWEQEVNGILVTLDTLENVVDEAIKKECNLIVSFHPILFTGIKKITGANYVERVLLKAIKNDIAIFSMHTALDNSPLGVNAKICEVLGLGNTKILRPKEGTIKKLTTYVPVDKADALRDGLFRAGAGSIGNYSECSFSVVGTGSFKPGTDAHPIIGQEGVTHFEKEVQLNLTFPAAFEKAVLSALFTNHPYDEVAYEMETLENSNQNIGMGMVGTLATPMKEIEFFQYLKSHMNASVIRHSTLLGKDVEKVAVLGGSGAFAILDAVRAGADVFVTADVKYHQFYQAEGQLVIADIGHYETEQFTKNLLVDFLKKKIPNFAVTLSESITNPIKYF